MTALSITLTLSYILIALNVFFEGYVQCILTIYILFSQLLKDPLPTFLPTQLFIFILSLKNQVQFVLANYSWV